MFVLDKDIVDTSLPLIESNWRELLFDVVPILYSGTNSFGNKIIGSIIDEDLENKFARFLHTVVDDKIFYQFLRYEITYLTLLKECKEKYFVDTTFDGRTFIFAISFDDIPTNYLPADDSYCPDLDNSASLLYGISLKGKQSDLHRAEVHDVNEVQFNIDSIFKTALSAINELDIQTKTYVEPAGIGSFRINFDIELENIQQRLFEIDKSSISNFIVKFLDYILIKLPNEDNDVLKESSDNLNSVIVSLQKVYDTSNAQIAPLVLEQKVMDNVNDAAIKFKELSLQINSSDSFSRIEWFNYSENGSEIPLGFVDKSYYSTITDKVVEDDEKIIKVIEEDKEPKRYRILIYGLSTDTGKGKARLYYDPNTEDFDKVSVHISTNKEIKNSVFTNGLHEGKVIDVFGKAQIINGSYKYLFIDYYDS